MRVGILVAVVLLMVGSVRAEGASGEVDLLAQQVAWKRLVREWEGSFAEVRVREAALHLAAREVEMIDAKMKVRGHSPEMDQLVMDSVERRRQAAESLEGARKCLGEVEGRMLEIYVEMLGEGARRRLERGLRVWGA